jgi:hypothetical protein
MKVLSEKTAAVVTQSLMPSSMIKVTNSGASISSLDQIVCPSTENLGFRVLILEAILFVLVGHSARA